jgi:hypothetical protein
VKLRAPTPRNERAGIRVQYEVLVYEKELRAA